MSVLWIHYGVVCGANRKELVRNGKLAKAAKSGIVCESAAVEKSIDESSIFSLVNTLPFFVCAVAKICGVA